MRKIHLFLVFIISSTLLFSCYYDNKEDVYKYSVKPTIVVTPTSDTTKVRYQLNIAPIMAGSCNSCHNKKFPSGTVATDNYDDVKSHIDRIYYRVSNGTMPPNGTKLDANSISLLLKWKDTGMLP